MVLAKALHIMNIKTHHVSESMRKEQGMCASSNRFIYYPRICIRICSRIRIQDKEKLTYNNNNNNNNKVDSSTICGNCSTKKPWKWNDRNERSWR